MLNTIKKRSNDRLTIALVGRVDASNASDLEQEVKSSLDGVTELVFDLEKLVYISSAGLRVLLAAHKAMAKKSGMKVVNANEMVKEVFDVTGFADILTIE